MRGFLTLKSEVKEQREKVAHQEELLVSHIAEIKSQIHDSLTSKTTLATATAAGALTGWFAAKPSTQKVDVNLEAENAEIDNVSVESQSQPILSQLSSQLTALGMSLIMAEVTEKASKMIDQAKQKNTEESG